MQLLAMEVEFELAVAIGLARIAMRAPCPAVPHDHVAAAVLSFGDMAFEIRVVQRVVFNMYR